MRLDRAVFDENGRVGEDQSASIPYEVYDDFNFFMGYYHIDIDFDDI
jgi:hypothetical protein